MKRLARAVCLLATTTLAVCGVRGAPRPPLAEEPAAQRAVDGGAAPCGSKTPCEPGEPADGGEP